MTIYIWADNEKSRLRKINNPNPTETIASIVCKKTKLGYIFYGRYTSHDNYMGYPYGEALYALIVLLQKHAIPYQLIEDTNLTLGDYYMQTNSYVELNKAAYQRLKKSPIL